MPISLDSLRTLGRGYTGQKVRTLYEARLQHVKTGFLCHSHKDAEFVKGIVERVREDGVDLYVDWEDTLMPDKPDRETAAQIQRKITETDWFLFLATPNSMASTWCPWEIGYADGKKPIDSIFVIQTTDGLGNAYGNEYLQLYRRIDGGIGQGLDFIEPGRFAGRSLRYI